MSELRENLVTRGYAVVPGVLDPGEVEHLREICWTAYTKRGQPDMGPREFLAARELLKVPFSARVISALKEMLGDDYTMFPDFNVQTNKFGGWHRDNNSEGRAAYLFAPDYLFVKCGVYLQGNDPDWGGGVDLVPGGYRWSVGDPQGLPSRILRHAYFKLRPRLMVPIEPGDFLCFDSRLYHRSTIPRAKLKSLPTTVVVGLPPEKRKHAIYWDASVTNGHVMKFVEHGLRRAQQEPFHAEVWSIKFPSSFPQDIVDVVERERINVASSPGRPA